jgi:DNA polymerase-1
LRATSIKSAGVPGVGEKTAAQLLAQFGNAETLLARTGEVANPRLRSAIEQAADRVGRNRVLMTLNDSLPVPVDWDRMRRLEPDYERLAACFERLEFKSLLEETRRLVQQRQGQLLLM